MQNDLPSKVLRLEYTMDSHIKLHRQDVRRIDNDIKDIGSDINDLKISNTELKIYTKDNTKANIANATSLKDISTIMTEYKGAIKVGVGLLASVGSLYTIVKIIAELKVIISG